MVGFDFTELNKLAADLGTVPTNSGPLLRKAVGAASLLVKNDAKKSVSGGSWRGAASAIDYELSASAGAGGSSIESEIGYNKSRPGGSVGNLREFGAPRAARVVRRVVNGKSVLVPLKGTVGVPLAPHNDLATALHANENEFASLVEKAIDDALGAAGL